jgi:hypothetical protein
MRVLSRNRPDRLILRGEPLSLPGFIPAVAGTGSLDRMIWPHLQRVAPLGVLVSAPSFFLVHHEPLSPPSRLWVDGGSFGVFAHGGTWVEQDDGTGLLRLRYQDTEVVMTWEILIGLQERHAAVGFTLDIPVPAGCPDAEARRRLSASVANARAMCSARDTLPRSDHKDRFLLYGSLPLADDRAATLASLDDLLALPLDGIALGGVAGRREAWAPCLDLVRIVRSRIGRLPLHVFGVGQPQRVRELQEAGADTVDSSSPLRAALSGRLVGPGRLGIEDPSPLERMHLALHNIATLSCVSLGLEAAGFLLSGRVVRLARDTGSDPESEESFP